MSALTMCSPGNNNLYQPEVFCINYRLWQTIQKNISDLLLMLLVIYKIIELRHIDINKKCYKWINDRNK